MLHARQMSKLSKLEVDAQLRLPEVSPLRQPLREIGWSVIDHWPTRSGAKEKQAAAIVYSDLVHGSSLKEEGFQTVWKVVDPKTDVVATVREAGAECAGLKIVVASRYSGTMKSLYEGALWPQTSRIRNASSRV